MKTNTPDSQLPDSNRKRDFFVFLIGLLPINFGAYWLCMVMNLSEIVLFAAAVFSLLNAIYYGFIWKELKPSLRLGLGAFFTVMGVICFLLYGVFVQGDPATQSKLTILAQFFGSLVFIYAFVFIYKHKTLKFWDRV